MQTTRFTIGSLELVVAALCVGFAFLKGNYLWFMGLSMMTVIGLLGCAIGASSEVGRPGTSMRGQSSTSRPV